MTSIWSQLVRVMQVHVEMQCHVTTWSASKATGKTIDVQNALTQALAERYAATDQQAAVRIALAAVGRGGEGELGQRIRDEILSVQSRNNAKVYIQSTTNRQNTLPDTILFGGAFYFCKRLSWGVAFASYFRNVWMCGSFRYGVAGHTRPKSMLDHSTIESVQYACFYCTGRHDGGVASKAA